MSGDTYTQRFAQTADGTTLSVHQVEGDGQLIVALHGFTGAGVTMLPLLDAIRDGRPALAVDIVGHGESDAPDYVDSYAMSSVVDQVLSIIGPHQPQTVHLVGYSMGGRIALSMAARAPWYFSSITSLSASPGIRDPNARTERYQADHDLAARLDEIGVERFVKEWLEKPLFAPYVSQLSEQARADTIRIRTSNSQRGLANSLRGTGTGSMPPIWDSLASLRSPLLAVAGALDPTYVEIAEEMASRAPYGHLAVIDGAGHVVHEEKFDAISGLVATFLQSCELSEDKRTASE